MMRRRSCSRIQSSSFAAARCACSLPAGSLLLCQTTKATVKEAKIAVAAGAQVRVSDAEIIANSVVNPARRM